MGICETQCEHSFVSTTDIHPDADGNIHDHANVYADRNTNEYAHSSLDNYADAYGHANPSRDINGYVD